MNEAIETKLAAGNWEFEDLPLVRDESALWSRVQEACNLTDQELSRLKNTRCPPLAQAPTATAAPPAMASKYRNAIQMPLPAWYIPNNDKDKRPNMLFKIRNEESEAMLEAVALSTSGTSGGLTLPARKLDQLGLKPAGIEKHIQTAGNAQSSIIQFVPHVKLTVEFIREDGQEDSRSCLVIPWCHSDEYNAYMASKPSDEPICEPPAAKRARSASENTKASEPSATSHSTPSIPHNIIYKAEISHIFHRSRGHPDDRASIGVDALSDLGIHIKCCGTSAMLEIEEESIFYE